MKILVISASAGAGHVRTGNAVIKHLKLKHPDWVMDHFDIAEFLPKILRRAIIDSYDSIAKKAPNLWKFIYEKTANNKFIHRGKIVLTLAEKLAARKLKDAILGFSPDLIICTHPWAVDLVNAIQDQIHNTPLFVVTTDYELHPYWGAHGVGKYFVASPAARQSLIDYGIKQETIFLSGIPIDSVFFLGKNNPQPNITKKSGTFSVLIMSGGGGFSAIDKIVKMLAEKGENIHIYAIAGQNEKLRQSMANIKPSNPSVSIEAIGWTDEIHKYIFSADVIITKPGGVTTTECFVAQKPIIAIHPIPGQEQANAKFILDNKLGITIEDENQIIKAIDFYRHGNFYPDLTYLPKPEIIVQEIEKTLM